jgi:hypothetical protein
MTSAHNVRTTRVVTIGPGPGIERGWRPGTSGFAILPGFLLGLLTACNPGRDAAPAMLVRDGAGPEIAENWIPAWSNGSAWRIGGRRFRSGAPEGSGEQTLDPGGGRVRLSDGTT